MSRRMPRERPGSSTAQVVRRAGVRSGPAAEALPEVQDALGSPGRPLDGATRAAMETRFGQDFSQVRVHTDPAAQASAQAVQALAYTVGDDIVFGAREYAPTSESGTRLLAHELAHVAQNRAGADQGLQRAPDEGAPSRLTLAPDLVFKPDPSLSSLHIDFSTLDGFALNSSTLTAEHQARIPDLARRLLMRLSTLPLGTITLTGHTDATGGEEYNRGLGLRRAEAVRDALVKAGVPMASMNTASAGESALIVKTQRAEPRNRRVEVRFEGHLLPPLPGLGRPGQLGRPPFTLTPGEPRPQPPVFPTTPAFPTAAPPVAQPPAGPATARPGSAGDIAKAVLALPPVKKAVDDLIQTHKNRLERELSSGEKVVVGATVVTIGAGFLAGIGSDPAARKTALDALNGTEIPVPGTNGFLKVQVLTPPTGGGGAVLKFDLTNAVRELK